MTAATIALSVAATLAAVAAMRWHDLRRQAAKARRGFLEAKSAYENAVQEMSRRVAVGEPGVVPAPAYPRNAFVTAYLTDSALPVTYAAMRDERDRAAHNAAVYRKALDVLDGEMRRLPYALAKDFETWNETDVPTSCRVRAVDVLEDVRSRSLQKVAGILVMLRQPRTLNSAEEMG